MKEGTHPTYYPNATVTCACGATFTVGSTQEEIRVEICSNCHPFYTGQRKLVDVGGRVERFQKIAEKAAKVKEARAKLDAQPKRKKKLDVISEREWREYERGKYRTVRPTPAKKPKKR